MSAPLLVTDRIGLARARERAVGPVAVVMTMGSLHEGHAELLRQARSRAATVFATVFVNPLQFGLEEDYERYPRAIEQDVEICRQQQVDVVFAPWPDVMYPAGEPQVTVHPGPLGDVLEGEVRPDHFAGVLTVVAKLLHLVKPDVAFFGEKDYQQLALVRQMARDLDMGVEIVGVPTVRESDGLAMSSRNAYLSSEERNQAKALFTALRAGAQEGPQGPEAVLGAATSVLREAEIAVDYVSLTDPLFGSAPDEGGARLLIACRVGKTRLIDNIPVTLGGS